MNYDLVVKGGRLITDHDSLVADLAIAGERIAAIGTELSAQREIDASGLYVLPGAVDGHVHLDNPTFPPYDPPTADTFLTGSMAAAFGGVTMLIDFAQPRPGQLLIEELERRKGDGKGQAVIDYSLHLNFRDPDPARLEEIPAVFEHGVPTFKLYMAYEGYRLSDAVIFRVMEAVAAQKGLVLMHAENFDITQELQRRLTAEAKTGPRWHTASHPSIVEGEAVHGALALAQLAGVPVLIFHVSCEEGVRELRLAKARGQAVFGETCPHYLTYTDEIYMRDDTLSQSLMVIPPIRDSSHLAALWQGLGDGSLDIVSTDHCPRAQRDDQTRQLAGASGLETRLALIHTFGVKAGRMSLNRWVEVCCTRPAEVFGLSHKGRLDPSYDADIVLFDPGKEVTFSAETLHTPINFSSYEGITVTGFPVMTISRGEVIVENGKLVGRPGRGRFIERSYS